MERVLSQWEPRINRAEAELTATFRFQNKEPAVLVVDANYWTFGDLADEIPPDYYTDPAAAFRSQMAKIEGHFDNIPHDDYIRSCIPGTAPACWRRRLASRSFATRSPIPPWPGQDHAPGGDRRAADACDGRVGRDALGGADD